MRTESGPQLGGGQAMGRRTSRTTATAMTLALLASLAHTAELPRDQVEQIKKATVFVQVTRRSLINGKDLACTVVTRTRGKRVDKRWYSDDVPVNGLVRHERSGNVVRELVAWGKAEK